MARNTLAVQTSNFLFLSISKIRTRLRPSPPWVINVIIIGSGGSLSSSSLLARFSALVSRLHRDSDSRLSQRGFLIKPTVNQKPIVIRMAGGGAQGHVVVLVLSVHWWCAHSQATTGCLASACLPLQSAHH